MCVCPNSNFRVQSDSHSREDFSTLTESPPVTAASQLSSIFIITPRYGKHKPSQSIMKTICGSPEFQNYLYIDCIQVFWGTFLPLHTFHLLHGIHSIHDIYDIYGIYDIHAAVFDVTPCQHILQGTVLIWCLSASTIIPPIIHLVLYSHSFTLQKHSSNSDIFSVSLQRFTHNTKLSNLLA